MREAELYAKRKRRRALTTTRDATHPVAPNVLNREFTATAPNTKWVTDITYIPTIQGWLSLAVILDLYSRAVVGWSMSGCCDEALAENALQMAVARRRPSPGFVHEYLEMYYNRQRRHSALGYVSPLVYEQMEKQYVKNNI